MDTGQGHVKNLKTVTVDNEFKSFNKLFKNVKFKHLSILRLIIMIINKIRMF